MTPEELNKAVQKQCSIIYDAMMRLVDLYHDHDEVQAWLDARGDNLLASSMDENALQWFVAGDEFPPTAKQFRHEREVAAIETQEKDAEHALRYAGG